MAQQMPVHAIHQAAPARWISRRETGSSVYMDSRLPNSLDLILPYFRDNFFSVSRTQVFVRTYGWNQPALPVNHGISKLIRVSGRDLGRLPVQEGEVLFYPFNAISNVKPTSNHHHKHVLILHGESNKVSSFRGVARLYDYVAVAGPLACRRYTKARVFTRKEVEGGRLVEMGDTFVQSVPWMRPADTGTGAWLLYAPTWESMSRTHDYSSLAEGFGFAAAEAAARTIGTRRILFKFHPNTGMGSIHYLRIVIEGLRRVAKSGFEIAIAAGSLNWRLRTALMISGLGGLILPASEEARVALALVDLSGMEAICLKQRVPHVVIVKPNGTHVWDDAELKRIYAHKAIPFGDPADVARAVPAYVARSVDLDDQHRNLVFGWADPLLRSASSEERHAWLLDYVAADPYWRG